jgi:hypothetical protein
MKIWFHSSTGLTGGGDVGRSFSVCAETACRGHGGEEAGEQTSADSDMS